MSMSASTVELGVAAVAVVGAALAFLVWRPRESKREESKYTQLEWPGWSDAIAQGARKESGFFQSAHGGVHLFWQEHRPPPTVRPRAALIFAHGVHEHCERFNHVFEELCAAHGIIVFSADHRKCVGPLSLVPACPMASA